MTEEKKKGAWGGARAGAGRKASGNKQRCIWVSDEEMDAIKNLLQDMRKDKKGKQN